MKTLNSISGGKTSAYMAVHYPADMNVFSAVCMDSDGGRLRDVGLLRECRAKLAGFDDRFAEFCGSPEDPKTFRVVLDLEQLLGREITWVRGESFEAMVRRKKALPNIAMRFCTTELKMRPIAEFIYGVTGGGKVWNRAGIRIDEPNRVKPDGHRSQYIDIVVGRHPDGRQKWLRDYEFAEASYPLIFAEDGSLDYVRKSVIYDWAADSGLDFPDRSNCQFCFHKTVVELKENQVRHPELFEAMGSVELAMGSVELAMGSSMKKDVWLSDLKDMSVHPEQFKLFFGGDSCESGFCTD